jgi:fructoselysine-6-P-deglycase FrlB-like protein
LGLRDEILEQPAAVQRLHAQLYAYHLTLARGLDAEHPRTINKVTETR